MRFRLAEPSDAPMLAAISIEVWLGTYIRRGVSDAFATYALTQFTPARLAAVIGDPDEHVIVSQNDDGPDAFIRISSGKAAPVAGCSTTEISTLYVQPRHQGRGLGRALLHQGLDHAAGKGAGSVWLTTNAENAPAIAFYQGNGFDRVGTTAFRIADHAYPNAVFSRTTAR